MGAITPISAVDHAILLCVPGTLPVALAALLDTFDRVSRYGDLELSPNPWEHPPEAIVTGGVPAVKGYFEAIFRGGTTVVTRPLKVVIVGKETVGKTRYDSTTCLVLQFPSYVHNRLRGIKLLPRYGPISCAHFTMILWMFTSHEWVQRMY